MNIQVLEIKNMNKIKTILSVIGAFTIFNIRTFSYLPNIRKRGFEFIRQMKIIGYDSIPLISITAAFTGFVTAVQATYQTKGYIPTSFIGVMIGKATMIELAPVLTGLVLTGKIGASIAAEIGTMKVSEQLDALVSMAIDPHDYLYLPRIFSGLIMIPLLTIYANLIGIFSGFVLSYFKYGTSFQKFFFNLKDYFDPNDLWGGIIKALFFGFIITSVGSFAGSRTENGAEGVGKVCTQTVVYSSILILIMDFLVAAILFGGYK